MLVAAKKLGAGVHGSFSSNFSHFNMMGVVQSGVEHPIAAPALILTLSGRRGGSLTGSSARLDGAGWKVLR